MEFRHPQKQHYLETTKFKVAFLAVASLSSLFGGVAIAVVGVAGRRFRTAYKTKTEEMEDPVLLASRALLWGTLYSVSGVGVISLTGAGIWKWWYV